MKNELGTDENYRSVSRVTPSSLWRGCACGGESKSEIPTVVQLLVVQSVPGAGAGFAWVDISINKIPCSNHLFSVPYFSSGTNLERDREVGESAFLLGCGHGKWALLSFVIP